jgi:nucleoid DNA-binding protein
VALTKTDIVELIAEKIDFRPAEAKDVLEELID